jgi:septal ring factor EnvC (AmiA/AmiB activator)
MKSIRVLPVLLLALLFLSGAPVSANQDLDGLKQKRKENQEQQAVKASQINAIEADVDEVQDALDVIIEDVAYKKADLDNAEYELNFAVDKAALAVEAEQRAEDEVLVLQDGLGELAVASYVEPAVDGLLTALSAGNILEAKERQVFESLTAGRDTSLLDEYRATTEDLEISRELAREYVAESDRAKKKVDSELGNLERSRDRQDILLDEVEFRLDRALGEAASLQAIDRDLANQIATREAEIARKLAEARKAAERARQRSRSSGGGSRSSKGAIPNRADIVSVQGIWVNKSISGNIDAMYTAARNAGINLGGGGYRNSSGQIALRRANCGSSEYAIYQAPSYSCRPPTARPGSSMHERGKAIDITVGGRIISSRGSAAYQWLAANAASYGMYNLPSEPWHWSTNGQ